MNYMARLEFSTYGDGGAANRNCADCISLSLNFRAAFPPNRASHSAAERSCRRQQVETTLQV